MNCETEAYLTEVTSQLRATAARHILDPRKPLPPKTTMRFVADIVYFPLSPLDGLTWVYELLVSPTLG